jgi:prevent-host-death family protein
MDTPLDRYSGHMTRKLTATEAKAKLLALLDEAAAGEEIEITKHGRTVARLAPATGPQSLKGSFAGLAITVSADEELFTSGAAWELS